MLLVSLCGSCSGIFVVMWVLVLNGLLFVIGCMRCWFCCRVVLLGLMLIWFSVWVILIKFILFVIFVVWWVCCCWFMFVCWVVLWCVDGGCF